MFMGRLRIDMYDPSMRFGKNERDIVYHTRQSRSNHAAMKICDDLCRNERQNRQSKRERSRVRSLKSVSQQMDGNEGFKRYAKRRRRG